MKGKIGTSTYIFSLFPKKLSKNISDLKLTKEVKSRLKWISYFKTPADIAYWM